MIKLTVEHDALTVYGSPADLEEIRDAILLHYLDKAERTPPGYTITVEEIPPPMPMPPPPSQWVVCDKCGARTMGGPGAICPACLQHKVRALGPHEKGHPGYEAAPPPVKKNGGVECDNEEGPCACGAWHGQETCETAPPLVPINAEEELKKRLGEQVKESLRAEREQANPRVIVRRGPQPPNPHLKGGPDLETMGSPSF